MPNTYTIFLTENDVYGKEKALNAIERMDLSTREVCGDGEHILYVNGVYRDNTKLGMLMHDFSCCDPNEMNYELMIEATKYYKENP